MLISQAFAQSPATDAAPQTTAETAVPANDAALVPQSTTSMLVQNIGMIVLLVIMFYFLLIRPQQKRFKEHKDMIDSLKKGDRVVTGGGLIGTIDTLIDNDEVIVDLGNGMKVTALRAMIQTKADKTAAAPKK